MGNSLMNFQNFSKNSKMHHFTEMGIFVKWCIWVSGGPGAEGRALTGPAPVSPVVPFRLFIGEKAYEMDHASSLLGGPIS